MEAVNGATCHLRRGDRLALYTTHCTRPSATGYKSDLQYPLQPFIVDDDGIFRDLTASIAACGARVQEPPHPPPSTTGTILEAIRSLKDQDLKANRAHVILLSPMAHVLHDASRHFPDLRLHHINPGPIRHRHNPGLQDTKCTDACCKNVITNWASHQSLLGRIERIIKNARAEEPVGELINVSIDVQARRGCELLTTYGNKHIPVLRLGQVHTFVMQVRVRRDETQTAEFQSGSPIFNFSLDAKGSRQELPNAAVGAIKTHLLDVQACYQNTLHIADCWNYTETSLLLSREPVKSVNMVLEAHGHDHRYFTGPIHLSANVAKAEAEISVIQSGKITSK